MRDAAGAEARPREADVPESGLRVYRHPAVAGLEAVCGEGVAADIVRHAHARLVVGLCLSGGRRIVAGDGQWLAEPGEGFVIPPGVAHACAPWDATGQAYVVVAASAACLPAGCAVARPADVRPRVWRDAAAASLLADAAGAVARGDPRALALFARLAARLDLRARPLPALSRPTRRAKAAIDAAPHLPVRVAALARLAGVSPFYLERLFARELGVPLGEYALSRRVALAAARIGAGEGLAEAALAAGFCDQSHLSRQFRRRMGVPPGKFLLMAGDASAGCAP
jgi:AraC-like DNA-binding protein/quercetin dioxygenase-like cupin family protein